MRTALPTRPRSATQYRPDRHALSRRSLLAGVTGAGGLAIAGCTSGNGTSAPTPSRVDMDAELRKPATVTVWTWVTIEEIARLFQKKYPSIKLNIVNAGQGGDEYTKFRTSLQARSGLPDVVQLEYNHIPGFRITDSLEDLTPYGAAGLAGKFNPAVWKLVSADAKVWALPTDGGPMAMMYRKDVLDRHQISVPTTWPEFAAAARKLHAADPTAYLANFPPADTGPFFGLAWQAGARPFTVKSRTDLKFSLNDASAKKLVQLWQPLIADGVVSVDPDFTDQWFKGMSSGKYAIWFVGAWGPYFLTTSAKDTAGKWRVAQIPQWTAGANESGYWGGSSLAVVKGSKAAAAGAAFIQFLTTDPEAYGIFVNKLHQYPVTTATLGDPAFVDNADPFYGGQKVNQILAKISQGVATDFQWSPVDEFVSSSITDTFGKAVAAKGNLSQGLDAWQKAVVDYSKKQGFTVEG